MKKKNNEKKEGFGISIDKLSEILKQRSAEVKKKYEEVCFKASDQKERRRIKKEMADDKMKILSDEVKEIISKKNDK